MAQPHVVILGGGPAGVGGAFYLRKRDRARATVLEQQMVLGGNAGSFEIEGIRVDFGSHRLHHACDPAILADLHTVLGDDLVNMPRHGRIRLRGKWLHFPLKPVDLMLRLDKGFAAGTLRDMVARQFNGKEEGETFESVLRANLGPTICEQFYFPYARKLWGMEPRELSGIQARKRVSAGSFKKLMKRLVKPPGAGHYYYPKQGYGQISTALAAAAVERGAEILMGWKVTGLSPSSNGRPGWKVTAERDGETRVIDADYVWSTIPTPLVARMMGSAVPAEVVGAAKSMSYRAMVLAYLVLDVDQFTTTDAHYFPEENVSVTRVSEPKNYARMTEPKGRTVLCAELPCAVGDALWSMTDAQLGEKVAADLARAGIPLPRPPIGVVSRRLKQAYPIYPKGYEIPFGVLDRWAESLPNFLLYGRQALFAHDNTHHALAMASGAVDCLSEGGFDAERWERYREVFATHVVED